MKILLVSMPTLHFFRWTEQLLGSGHEFYWFDINDGGEKVERLSDVHQITNWKHRVRYPGRYLLKQQTPAIYKLIERINSRDTNSVFRKVVREIKPDAVHSFALYVACTPILKTMQLLPELPWVFSSWGSDLYYFQNDPKYLADIKQVLPRIDYMFSDCNRDFQIAESYGFQGKFLGVYPGGGGFKLDELDRFIKPFENRRSLLVKGFQGRSGRAIQVLQALERLRDSLKDIDVIVFGAGDEVLEHLKNHNLSEILQLTVHERIGHEEVLKLMGSAMIYIGNSNSDGIPNTLLEAICLGAFPIQSNPGRVTEEVIRDGENGLLIDDCEDVNIIAETIKIALQDPEMIRAGAAENMRTMRPKLGYEHIRTEVLKKYDQIKFPNPIKT